MFVPLAVFVPLVLVVPLVELSILGVVLGMDPFVVWVELASVVPEGGDGAILGGNATTPGGGLHESYRHV